MTFQELSNLFDFKIPSLCGNRIPNCVAVSCQDNKILVGDTKNPEQEVLSFTQEEWQAFITGVKNNEFNFSIE